MIIIKIKIKYFSDIPHCINILVLPINLLTLYKIIRDAASKKKTWYNIVTFPKGGGGS